ncbi:Glyoxalase-like domain protein [Planctomycetes bacterium Pla163]|uniref:Glyoxalase-like domain protein n=1 Tax=Rohdeia mirabilis TaxID=2528008 RepID=A0A518CVZ4_9BACT|nr:Glyoxalase-like domain protein [Planctomycetes bacterium Pla163]
MDIRGIDHVQIAIPVGEEERARAFWIGVLGFDEVAKPPVNAGNGGCWFERAGIALHLGVEADFKPARKAHVAFLVADLDGTQRALEAADAPISAGGAIPGYRRLFSADPFGNRLEFMQRVDRVER